MAERLYSEKFEIFRSNLLPSIIKLRHLTYSYSSGQGGAKRRPVFNVRLFESVRLKQTAQNGSSCAISYFQTESKI